MKKRLVTFLSLIFVFTFLLAGCGASKGSDQDKADATLEPTTQIAEETTSQIESPSTTLEDGVYDAEFHTDSSMFHVNEACEGKGTLTVKDGEMSIHISLPSKNIVNLYQGLVSDAEKDGAQLLEPTTDEVTYSDGYKEEVYGFDVPVPVLEQEFDLALIGTKGKWYDHKVSVSNPVPAE